MKITYIYHSCFVVELKKSILIFDYFKGMLPKLPADKPIYFFASHKHQDHFSLCIFNQFQENCHITYILANDIRLSEQYLKRNGCPDNIKDKIITIGKNKELILQPDLKIRTLKSTDAGVAFVVETEGNSIYHAGDLNWWHWEGESRQFNDAQKQVYLKQLMLIKDIHFKVAFVPLDYRLEEAADWGITKFCELIKADYVFPMHMWEHYELTEECIKTRGLGAYKERIAAVQNENESWIIE